MSEQIKDKNGQFQEGRQQQKNEYTRKRYDRAEMILPKGMKVRLEETAKGQEFMTGPMTPLKTSVLIPAFVRESAVAQNLSVVIF